MLLYAGMSKKNKKISPSNKLTNIVIIKCNSAGMYVWRNNTVGIFDPIKKIYRQNVTHRGVGDIVGVTAEGTHIEFEIKIGKDSQNKYQVAHEKEIVRRGGLYFVVKDEQDIDKFISSIKNNKKHV